MPGSTELVLLALGPSPGPRPRSPLDRPRVSARTGRRAGRFVQEWRFGVRGPRLLLPLRSRSRTSRAAQDRAGLRLAPGFESARWYGRGPHECYSDRKAGAALGIYAASVDALGVPYVLPQENGNRTESVGSSSPRALAPVSPTPARPASESNLPRPSTSPRPTTTPKRSGKPAIAATWFRGPRYPFASTSRNAGSGRPAAGRTLWSATG